MDRGYINFARFHALHLSQAFFVTCAKTNLRYRRAYSRPVDKTTGLRRDQPIRLTGTQASQDYPIQLRRVKFYDAKNDKLLVFLTNNFDLPALTIAELYRCRSYTNLNRFSLLPSPKGEGQDEGIYITTFWDWYYSSNGSSGICGSRRFLALPKMPKTQVWITIAVHVLVAILKRRLKSEASPCTILQILSLTLFDKTLLNQLVTNTEFNSEELKISNQLNLLD